jgi:F-type H+-transporting ATPase subunit a
MNIIEQFSKLLTLGLRLFGNIFAGEVMISVILKASFFGIIPLIAWQGFSIFIGTIQAFIFTTLTMVYLSQNMKHEEHEH